MTITKIINKDKFSLSRDYFIIIGATLFIVLFTTGLYSWFSYKQFIRNEKKQLISSSSKIQQSLEESFGYSNHLMDYFARQINHLSSKDTKIITKLLRGELSSDPVVKQLFSWTLFDWIDKDNRLISTTLLGDAVEVIDMSDREYIKSVKANPWSLCFSQPAIGKPSGQWIIPAAFGITDNNNHYLGAIGMGFNIASLKAKIEQELMGYSNLSYIILNDKLEIILSSSDTTTINKPNHIKDIDKSFSKPNVPFEFLQNPINDQNNSYLYFKEMPNKPFIILTGYDKNIRFQEIKDALIERASGTLIIGLILISALLMLRKMLILPIVLLSKTAEKIITTEGEEEITLSPSNIKELRILWLQVINLREFIIRLKSSEKKLKTSKIDLEKAHHNIKKTNNELEDKVLERTTLLEKALAVKTEFLNNISHEIRTPLQGFMGISESLDANWDMYDDAKKHQYTHEIAKNAKRLASLIGNLLDLAKFNEGKLLLDLCKFDFNQFIEDIIDEARTLYIDKKNITLVFEKSESSADIMADIHKIGQVLRNLIINAIKFSPKDSLITLKLMMGGLKDNDGNIIPGMHFSIIDEGVGVPSEELTSIFDPFVQSSRTKTRAGGTGLGLTICKKIITAHHGEIWAENNSKSKGAIFHVIIPILQSKILEDSEQKRHPKLATSPTKISTVMIIDDEMSILMTMELILRSLNYQVVKANGGIEGLQLLEKNHQNIDLIFLDLMMPDIYGINVLKEIKKDHNTKNIPVIIQSSVVDEKEKQRCFDLGAFSFLQKPYNKKEVLAKIEELLNSY